MQILANYSRTSEDENEHSICAMVGNAIINRDSMPQSLEDRLIKSEFLPDKLLEIMKLPASALTHYTFFKTYAMHGLVIKTNLHLSVSFSSKY